MGATPKAAAFLATASGWQGEVKDACQAEPRLRAYSQRDGNLCGKAASSE
jgi:hypothetical protein